MRWGEVDVRAKVKVKVKVSVGELRVNHIHNMIQPKPF